MTLAERMEVWKVTERVPSESEMGNLLLGVEGALKELYRMGVGHRCINLDTILCLNSLYKLTDISMITCTSRLPQS